MRLHSIFQEKKLLWSALLPDAPKACLEPLSRQELLGKSALIEAKGANTGKLVQEKLHITSLSYLNTVSKDCWDMGDRAKKRTNFTSFFAVVSNGFFLNRQANKGKLQNAGSMGFVLAKGEIPKASSPTAQILLIFSSFEKSDLNNALNLFQKYLTSLTNRLTALKDFKIIKGMNAIHASRVSGASSGAPSSKLQDSKIAGILRAVRDLNQPFKSTDICLSTKLYTVIRSPHVFKKTREQFAMTKIKRIVQLNFQSKAALRLLIDSLILLKLPAEVKVIIRDY